MKLGALEVNWMLNRRTPWFKRQFRTLDFSKKRHNTPYVTTAGAALSVVASVLLSVTQGFSIELTGINLG
jgi:hypothetical protein